MIACSPLVWVIICFIVSKKIPYNQREWRSCIFLCSLYLVNVDLSWVPQFSARQKYLRLVSLWLARNFLHMKSNQPPFLFPTFTDCFIESSLMWNGGKIISSPSTNYINVITFFSSTTIFSIRGYCFITKWSSLYLLSQRYTKRGYLTDPLENSISLDLHKLTKGNLRWYLLYWSLLFSHFSWVTNWNWSIFIAIV